MKRYLATLHKKPDHHKKRFAFLVSSTITLIIFGVWSLTTFGTGGETLVAKVEREVSPFQSLRMSLADTLDALKSSLGELNSSLQKADLKTGYTEMRDGALDIYGQ